jgi:hypothetical protein
VQSTITTGIVFALLGAGKIPHVEIDMLKSVVYDEISSMIPRITQNQL